MPPAFSSFLSYDYTHMTIATRSIWYT